jgi:hypothetical protein
MMQKPICSRNDYEMALREMEAYFEREPDAGTPQAARFDELLRMVEEFEAAHYVIECPGCGEIRLELQEDHAPLPIDINSITEQVLAEFCQGCASHLNDPFQPVSDNPLTTLAIKSTDTNNLPRLSDK